MTKTPGFKEISVYKARGGQKPLWNSFGKALFNKVSSEWFRIIGAGNSADNAIKDYQAQFRRLAKLGKV